METSVRGLKSLEAESGTVGQRSWEPLKEGGFGANPFNKYRSDKNMNLKCKCQRISYTMLINEVLVNECFN